jgi:hypothetical protein
VCRNDREVVAVWVPFDQASLVSIRVEWVIIFNDGESSERQLPAVLRLRARSAVTREATSAAFEDMPRT